MSTTPHSLAPVRPPLTPLELVEHARLFGDEVAAGRYPYVRYDAEHRWHQRLYRDQRLDIWLISWLPTQGTQLHDHGGSAGAFSVLTGELNEAVYRQAAEDQSLTEFRRSAGAAVGFGSRYVHDVRNLSDAPAVSVHAYSPPLTSMNFYDVASDGGLNRLATLATEDPEPDLDSASDPRIVTARAHGDVMTSTISAGRAAAQFDSVDDLLADARRSLRRVDVREAIEAVAAGARFVDIRPAWQRIREGEIEWFADRRAQPSGVATAPRLVRTPALGRSRSAVDRRLLRGLHLIPGRRRAGLARRARDRPDRWHDGVACGRPAHRRRPQPGRVDRRGRVTGGFDRGRRPHRPGALVRRRLSRPAGPGSRPSRSGPSE